MQPADKKIEIRKVENEDDDWKAGVSLIYGAVSFIGQTSTHPHAYFAAYSGGEMAGHAVILFTGGRWVLDGLRVKPEYRERGIGKALTKARILYAVSQGAEAIWYCCAGDNLVSTCCHESFGFKKAGETAPGEAPKFSQWYKLDVRELKI